VGRRPESKAATAARPGRQGERAIHDAAHGHPRLRDLNGAGATAVTAGTRVGSLTGLLAEPQVRLGIGTAVLLVTALAVRRDRVSLGEAKAFRVVNGLPDALHAPAWAIMQLGTLGAAPVAAGMAWLADDRELAGRLLASGTGTWALSKLVKQMVRRPRPAALLAGTRRRGRDAAGLGYLSGHAGVAVALGAAALPRLGTTGRALTVAAVPVVGLTRVYVGAHLPLDIVGGAALGLAVEALVSLATSGNRHACGTPRRGL
jgi:membrane-associated phospholipid phosphatase